jgi:hypothetical protein
VELQLTKVRFLNISLKKKKYIYIYIFMCVCVYKFLYIFVLLLDTFVVYIPNKLPKTMYGTPVYKIFLGKLIVNLRISYPLHACSRLSSN